MAFKNIDGGGVIVTGAASTNLVRLMALVSALRFEVRTGMRMTRGVSPAQVLKTELGITGSKARILEQAEQLLAAVRANAGAQEVQ